MAKNKQPDNQLDLLEEFAATEKPKVEVSAEKLSQKTESPVDKESAADKAIREINEKIDAARAKRKKEEEGKWAETSLKKIRTEIEAEQTPAKPTAEESELSDYIEPFTPADEYYGRWNKYRKSN